MTKYVCIAVLVCLLGSRAAGQTTVEMRTSGVVEAGNAVLLRDVAEVAGDDAASLASLEVAPAPSGRYVEIGVDAVRAALDGAQVRWGRTVLRGTVCSVTVRGQAKASEPAAAPAAGKPGPEVVPLTGPETVRTQVARSLARLYAVDATGLRLAFEARDAELLATPTSGKRIEVHPTNSASTSRVGVRVYVFEGDRLAQQRTISVEALVRRSVVTATRAIGRGEEIGEDQYSVSEQWLAPSAAVPCGPDEVRGRVARSKISAGQVILRASVQAPVVVNKGDIVEVHCLSGSVHLRATRARALEQGRDGDLVSFQLEGSKNTFKARMSGRGTAVMVLDRVGAEQIGSNSTEEQR